MWEYEESEIFYCQLNSIESFNRQRGSATLLDESGRFLCNRNPFFDASREKSRACRNPARKRIDSGP
jgi:hypothetical protein